MADVQTLAAELKETRRLLKILKTSPKAHRHELDWHIKPASQPHKNFCDCM